MARPRQVITLAERRALLLRRNELSTIVQLPNWDVLNAVVEEEIEQLKRVVMAKAMGEGMTLEDQALMRGRIAGMRAVLAIPRNANRKQVREEAAAGE